MKSGGRTTERRSTELFVSARIWPLPPERAVLESRPRVVAFSLLLRFIAPMFFSAWRVRKRRFAAFVVRPPRGPECFSRHKLSTRMTMSFQQLPLRKANVVCWDLIISSGFRDCSYCRALLYLLSFASSLKAYSFLRSMPLAFFTPCFARKLSRTIPWNERWGDLTRVSRREGAADVVFRNYFVIAQCTGNAPFGSLSKPRL